jgi:hypothetical protein
MEALIDIDIDRQHVGACGLLVGSSGLLLLGAHGGLLGAREGEGGIYRK